MTTTSLTLAQERALAIINERGCVGAGNMQQVGLATVRVLERHGLCTVQTHLVKIQNQWRAKWVTDWTARKIEED